MLVLLVKFTLCVQFPHLFVGALNHVMEKVSLIPLCQRYIAVGYQTGQVMNLIVDYRRMAVDSVAGLHDEQDLIQVGSSAWKVMSKGMMLLLVTKEIHVLSFLIDSKTAAVLKKNLHIGQHNFSVTDGNVEIGFSPLSTDFQEVRKIFGISCSPNGTYVIVATWPLKKFDWKFMKRRPMHVYTLPLKPDAETRKSAEKLLLDETVPMKHIPDVLEYFRQCLWSGVNIIPSLTNFVTQTHKWFSMNVKLLRVLRYSTQVKHQHFVLADNGKHLPESFFLASPEFDGNSTVKTNFSKCNDVRGTQQIFHMEQSSRSQILEVFRMHTHSNSPRTNETPCSQHTRPPL
uniref:Uncharacterized protein n=1 Tax=Magallana gigas TaxID=29159 RepID=K1RE66_MAGGI